MKIKNKFLRINLIFYEKLYFINKILLIKMNDYISGSISGLVVCLIGHPLDTLKTISQSRNKGIVTPHKWYRVYNGIKYPLVGSSIVHSCMFGTNKYLNKKTQNHYVSGFLTGNLTNTDGDVWSSYSTSASANAVSHVPHQFTGFNPR